MNLLEPLQLFLIWFLVTAVSGWPKPKICPLPEPLRWTVLPKERYGNFLNGRGSNTQPSNWEGDTLPLSYCRPLQPSVLTVSVMNEGTFKLKSSLRVRLTRRPNGTDNGPWRCRTNSLSTWRAVEAFSVDFAEDGVDRTQSRIFFIKINACTIIAEMDSLRSVLSNNTTRSVVAYVASSLRLQLCWSISLADNLDHHQGLEWHRCSKRKT